MLRLLGILDCPVNPLRIRLYPLSREETVFEQTTQDAIEKTSAFDNTRGKLRKSLGLLCEDCTRAWMEQCDEEYG